MITMAPKLSRTEMVQAVQLYAAKMYGKYSWDFVVECLSPEDIDRLIGQKTRTANGAIKDVYANFVRIQHEQAIFHKNEVEAFGG